MALLTVAAVRAVVETALTDPELAAVIEREEAEAVRRFGPIGDGASPATATVAGGGASLFLPKAVAALTSVAERAGLASPLAPVDASRYLRWDAQGRLDRIDGVWGTQVVVTYTPADERERWTAVLIEVVRQAVEQTALRGASVAGEYSFQAPDWEQQRRQLYRRLRFMSV